MQSAVQIYFKVIISTKFFKQNIDAINGVKALETNYPSWTTYFLNKKIRAKLFLASIVIIIYQLTHYMFIDINTIIEWIYLNGLNSLAIILVVIAILPSFINLFRYFHKTCRNYIKIGNPATISLIVVIIFVSHLFWPDRVALDSGLLGLLVILIIPWLPPLIRYLELPGGLKIQFTEEIQNLERNATKAGLIPPESIGESTSVLKVEDDGNISIFQRIVEEDPAIALAGLRIEIERQLVQLAKLKKIKTARKGIIRLLPALNESGALSDRETDSIHELIRLLNSAVHGADVKKEDAIVAIDIGMYILESLNKKIADTDSSSQIIEVA